MQDSRRRHVADRRSVLAGLATCGIAALAGQGLPAWAGEDAGAVDHAPWTALLRTYVVMAGDGIARVDYAAFKARGRPALTSYLQSLQAVEVGKLGRADEFAFWVNLYNAKTIDIVLAHYPVRSIKDINLGGSLLSAFTGGPWSAKVVRVAGRDLSLDDIEHRILRPVFKDPRIHYAVNCASLGCPNLLGQALTAASLEVTLDSAARAYVNHPRGVSRNPEGLVVSSIYDWFAEDFGGAPQGVLRHLTRFAQGSLAEALPEVTSIAGYAYDWSLNDA